MNRSYSKIRHIQEANERLEKRIISEKIGDKLEPNLLGSKKGNVTKLHSEFLNYHYNINLNSSNTGSWTDKDFNDNLKKFMEENNVSVWICKTGDGWCPDGSDGEVTTKELEKLDKAFGKYINTTTNPELYTKFITEFPNFKKNSQQISGSTEVLGGLINNWHDKTYDYKLEDGKYYYQKKNSQQPQWIEAKGKGLEAIKKNVKFQK